MSQLALPLSLEDRGVFESFWNGGNEALVAFLTALADSSRQDGLPAGCWIRGGEATGKTHLLQAVCERLGDDSVYVPLERFTASGPGVLAGLSSRRCICLDNIDAAAADEQFEMALFTLLNEVADCGALLVVAARAAPRDCSFVLPDLLSRLSRLPLFKLQPLDEAGRIHALQLRATHRGLQLPEETARFMLSRSRRDMASLYRLLDLLDTEALKAQRRLTIPFVRAILAGGEDS